MKKILLALMVICIYINSYGQNLSSTDSEIDQKDLKEIIKVLSSDSLEGRQTGTAGEKKAARFISEKFQELGLCKYDSNGYYQKFKLKESYWGDVYLKSDNKIIRNFEEMLFLGSSPQNTEIEKEVVFGGNGSDEELNRISVDDRIVVIFLNNVRSSAVLHETLAKRKAFALILANPSNYKQFESMKNTMKEFMLKKRLYLPGIKKSRFDTIRFLNEFIIPNSQIHSVLGLSAAKLKDLIKTNNIQNCPLTKIKIKCERVVNEIEAENVVGFLKGKSSKSIIISAHYDHLGIADKMHFPGANDNGSGVAAILELAEKFSKVKDLTNNLIFIATTGEEEGLLGSKYYVNNGFDSLNILCNFNIDMVGRIDDKPHKNENYLYSIGSDIFKNLDEKIKIADNSYPDCQIDYAYNNSKDIAGVYARSDQYSFYNTGIPAIMFFGGLHKDYHTSADIVQKIDLELLQKRTILISKIIELVQDEKMNWKTK